MPDDLRVNHSHGLLNGAASTIIINQSTGAVTITPVSGQGLTLAAGDLILSAAASHIVPGATSLSMRNNANNADNLISTDAGVVTIRAGLVLTAGILFVNDTTNAGMTTGLTLNQGAADDEILAFKSSDVAHGITSQLETDTFGKIQKSSATGGIQVVGANASTTVSRAVFIQGYSSDLTPDATKTTAGTGIVNTEAYIKSGTSVTNPPAGSNIFVMSEGSLARFIFDADGHFKLNQDANGQGMEILTLTELTTIAAAANTSTTIQIPANALVFAVSCRVTTVIPTATAFDIGISGATTRYGSALNVAADTTNPGTNDGMRYYASATSILITPNGTPADNTGRLRVTIHYIALTVPTS